MGVGAADETPRAVVSCSLPYCHKLVSSCLISISVVFKGFYFATLLTV